MGEWTGLELEPMSYVKHPEQSISSGRMRADKLSFSNIQYYGVRENTKEPINVENCIERDEDQKNMRFRLVAKQRLLVFYI